MSKWVKTVGGEAYGKCGLVFGAEPIEVDCETLATETPRGLVGDRLAADPRLVCADAPAARETAGDWREMSLEDAGISPEIVAILAEADPPIHTLGTLDAFLEDGNILVDIDGIGAGRAAMIEAAWLAHRPG